MKTIIFGNGKTGFALKKLMKKLGNDAVIYDDDTTKTEIPKDKLAFDCNTLLLISPGISKQNAVVQTAIKRGAKISGELAYCSKYLHDKWVSVTGTNGKTTICEMVKHILTESGVPCSLLGNGGVPLATNCFTNDIVICESSSFQLDDCTSFDPYISVLASLDVDHLDYHKTMENYVRAKCNNFLHQSTNHFAIFNADDDNVVQVSQKCKCHKLFYSTYKANADFFFDGECYVAKTKFAEKVPGTYLSTLCKHNLSNALCAVAVVTLLGVSAKQAVKSLESFRFLPHRFETVCTKNGITFIDDSKGTNVHATLTALNSLCGNVAVILGGYDKGSSFDDLFEKLPENVFFVTAFGETSNKIASSARKYGYKNVQMCESLEQAVNVGYQKLLSMGGTLIMSNACSSFDGYKNYAERGEAFCKAVKALC